MKLTEIPASILSASNGYETARGIRTLDVRLVSERDGMAVLHGKKSDRTISVFLALRMGSGSWVWFCPTEETMAGITAFTRHYNKIDTINDGRRSVVV